MVISIARKVDVAKSSLFINSSIWDLHYFLSNLDLQRSYILKLRAGKFTIIFYAIRRYCINWSNHLSSQVTQISCTAEITFNGISGFYLRGSWRLPLTLPFVRYIQYA